MKSNRGLAGAIECRLQPNASSVFSGIVHPGDLFDVSICNPPFHASAAEARKGTQRKWKNLGRQKSGSRVLNFGGLSAELWCRGGESAFVRAMIDQSAAMPSTCLWFTTLIAKSEHLAAVHRALKAAHAAEVRVIGMSQGQKVSRIVAWTFHSPEQQRQWRLTRWRA